jgi:hypothetical protein
MSQKASNILFDKLQRFIKKHYLYHLTKGTLIFIASAFGLYLFLSVIIGASFFPEWVRGTLFFGYLIGISLAFIKLVFAPFLGFLGVKQDLEEERAAEMIGRHFPEIEDKLLNLIQLQKEQEAGEMIKAAIAQKAFSIAPFQFDKAINLRQALRVGKYMLAVLFFGLLLWATGQWYLVQAGSEKLLNYNKSYVPEAPFELELPNDLEAVFGEDIQVEMNFKGRGYPDIVQIRLGGQMILASGSGSAYHYSFKRVQKPFQFFVEASGFLFGPYQVKVVFPPIIENFELRIDPPLHTGLAGFSISQFTDVVFPEGSVLHFDLKTNHTESVSLVLDTGNLYFKQDKKLFRLHKQVLQSFKGSLSASGNGLDVPLSGQSAFTVIKDAFPRIEVSLFRDSVNLNTLYFNGIASDDYGIRRISWQILDSDGKMLHKEERKSAQRSVQISEEIRLGSLGIIIPEGAKIIWEVWDNDGINGAKSTRSGSFDIVFIDRNRMRDILKQKESANANELSKQIESLKKQKEQIDKAKDGMSQQKKKSWQDQKEVKQLMDKQNSLLKQLDKIKEQAKEQSVLDEKEELFSEKLLEKQKRIDELLDELADDEMKRLMEEINKLMEDLKKDGLQEKMEQLNMENEHLLKQMERYMELLEQLRFEKGLEESIEELTRIEEEQEAMTEEEGMDRNAQDGLKEETEQALEKLDQLKKQDEDLKTPNGLEIPKDELEDAMDEMQKAGDAMDKKQSPKGNQKNAKKKVSDAKKSLMDMQSQMASQQNAENMKDLRQILENLLALSFDQESLMDQMRKEGKNSPRYPEFMRNQRMLKDNSRIIADSLYALSTRVEQIKPFVQKEMMKIDRSFDKSLAFFAERELGKGNGEQQFVMTSTNNLANLLQQALEQMQQQQAMMSEGNQQCQKPGQGKGSMESLKKMQQQLAEQLGKMKDGEQGDPQPGQKNSRMSKEIVEMMAKQETVRKALEQMKDGGKEDGGKTGDGNLEQIIEEMKKNEEDLANQKFDKAFFERQQEILTRLLEAENAELKQQQDEQRIGETSKDIQNSNQTRFEDFIREREKQIESMRYGNPAYRPFYQEKQRGFSERKL